MKNKWTRGDEAIRSFVGTWFQIIKEDVDICFPAI
ncbi:BnaA06g20060D [Brassica napus]|uniref:BnaA06g20060D protein n=1 Tax=Brassica napus TaxID=3708 RepID=A0A078FJR0_BRANA|nr:BnaA06g20060D [Brassica napus]